ncbi:hypothetical protein P280DRAFT_64106 [Massarina eburnea CBS 473.64]|uniref:RRM domain-containing protein n=1 Tax=Massarina eburnea CBS 473.64 TaxID=1395130 RepID=A0A6A6RY15_9PLEO|nr:hypothetical protein P280DRAFT_64106 [Massarina eburnea CBS 473.64]
MVLPGMYPFSSPVPSLSPAPAQSETGPFTVTASGFSRHSSAWDIERFICRQGVEILSCQVDTADDAVMAEIIVATKELAEKVVKQLSGIKGYTPLEMSMKPTIVLPPRQPTLILETNRQETHKPTAGKEDKVVGTNDKHCQIGHATTKSGVARLTEEFGKLNIVSPTTEGEIHKLQEEKCHVSKPEDKSPLQKKASAAGDSTNSKMSYQNHLFLAIRREREKRGL